MVLEFLRFLVLIKRVVQTWTDRSVLRRKS